MDDLLKYHDRIDVMIFEFHWVDKNLKDFTECVTKILKYFSIVHIHGNNHNQFVEGVNIPIVPEITFVNNKFIKQIRVENFILLAAIISLIIETIPLRSSGSLFTTNNATYLILIGSIILSYKTILKIKIE